MLKRLLNLSLRPKRCLPVIQTRFFTIESKDDVVRHSDDIVDDIEQFPPNKSSIKDNFPTTTSVISLFVEKLNCSNDKAEEIATKHEENIQVLTLKELTQQLKVFLDLGIPQEILLKYPEIIVMNPKLVEIQLQMLLELPEIVKGTSLIDYWPLMQLSPKNLQKVKKQMFREFRYVPKGSRIHYVSAKLSIEPYVAAAVFSNYTFLFRIPLRSLYTNLELVLEFKIPAANILRDPWIFQYSPRQVRQRLTKAQKVRDELMPWMIHCPPSRLEKSLQVTQEIKEILNTSDSKDTIDYLSYRLGYEKNEIEMYFAKFPAALKVRPNKIKQVLDFLLLEAGYKPSQVVAVPRILTFGLKQMKKRHEELQALRYHVISLMVFCMTRKAYSTFVERVRSHRHYWKRNKTKSET